MFNFLKKTFNRRYTVLIVSHQAGRSRSIGISLKGAAVLFCLWAIVTAAGATFFIQGQSLWSAWAEAKLYTVRVKMLASEVAKMRQAARGMAMVEADFKYLMSQGAGVIDQKNINPLAISSINAGAPDTLTELLAGKITEGTLARAQWERKTFIEHSSLLLADSSQSLLEHHDRMVRNAAIPANWPAYGAITSRFGVRINPFQHFQSDGNSEIHRGIDVANVEGTPIRAAAAGIVRRAEWVGSFGRTVTLDHGFGFSTLYAHASKITVSEGDRVERGDIIAYMGTTGRSTGSHLHFEVWERGRPVNPLRLARFEDSSAAEDSLLAKKAESSIILLPHGMGGAAQDY
ncbi:MAG: M23 family metallopeptidase [Elusimicrobia bacterium]|nr:M23 family metallopeptidase [Elusimicrobiota bacterium]